jgi:hypothetical protein
MNLKYTLILCLISAITAASLTKYYFPTVQTQTRDVVHDVTHTKIQTVTKTVKLPNGEVDTSVTTDKDIVDSLNRIADQVTLKTPKNWQAGISYGTDIHTLQPIYGGELKYRVLGPAFIGATINTTGYLGGTLSVEF